MPQLTESFDNIDSLRPVAANAVSDGVFIFSSNPFVNGSHVSLVVDPSGHSHMIYANTSDINIDFPNNPTYHLSFDAISMNGSVDTIWVYNKAWQINNTSYTHIDFNTYVAPDQYAAFKAMSIQSLHGLNSPAIDNVSIDIIPEISSTLFLLAGLTITILWQHLKDMK